MAFPGRYEASGLVWSIRGAPYARRTRITLLIQGPFAQCLRDHPELRTNALQTLTRALQVNTPTDTGSLVASVRIEGMGAGAVSLGPEPYNRARLKAAQAGRIYKQRVRRPKPSKFYAIPANVRSGQPSYIENSIDLASAEVAKLCMKISAAEAKQRQLEATLAGRPSFAVEFSGFGRKYTRPSSQPTPARQAPGLEVKFSGFGRR